MTRGARQQALLRLIADDPSLAASVDAALLAAIALGGGQEAAETLDKAAGVSTDDASTGVTLYTDAASVVLLDPSALSCPADERRLSDAAGRFGSASSLQSASSCCSSVSQPSPSRSRRGKRASPTPGLPLGSSRSRELIERVVQAAETTSQALHSLSQSSQSGTNASEHSEVEASSGPLAPRVVLDHRCFVSRDQYVPHSARRACTVCLREFSLLRQRHSCRMCGDVVCSRCSAFQPVDLPVVDSKLRVCSSCFIAYRKRLEGGDGDGQEQPEGRDERQAGNNAAEPLCYVLVEPETMALVANAGPSKSDARASASKTSRSAPPPVLTPSSSSSDMASMSESSSSLLSFESAPSDWPWEDSSLDPRGGASDELEAARRARQLEREVEASEQRIRLLETQIAEQENQTELLSMEQQAQLQEARATIQALQEQLRRQELSAKEAAHARDSICLQNLHKLRKTELAAGSSSSSSCSSSTDGDSDDSVALRKRLKVLERQLQQAGISVADVVPYDVARRKVAEISKRLQELGASDVAAGDRLAQAAARREYFMLEQQMDRYHTALLLTDEYIDEQRRAEEAWEAAHCEANAAAAKLLRSAIPVDVSRRTERGLVEQPTPTGVAFPSELARRLKRTNALQLLRVDPRVVSKMHPSVIEAFRTSGLALVERRALHHALSAPARAWKARQQADEMARRKLGWFSKLKDALVLAIDAEERHLAATDGTTEEHSCGLIGLACPVRSDARMRALYGSGLGFPSEPKFLPAEIVKGEPDGVGGKARKEAEQVAQASTAVAQRRRQELQTHYGPRNVRELALALGALDETEALLGCVRQQDDAFPMHSLGVEGAVEMASERLVASVKELGLALAKRAGVSLTGKRQLATDALDTRSGVEVAFSADAVAFARSVMSDMAGLFANRWPVELQRAFTGVSELLSDVSDKNAAALDLLALANVSAWRGEDAFGRTAWRDRTQDTTNGGTRPTSDTSLRLAAEPTSAAMFDAIRARRRNAREEESASPAASAPAHRPPLSGTSGRPSDLLAAIRTRKTTQSAAKA